MQRLNLILVMVLAVACFGYAQKSGASASGSTSATMPANSGTTTPGATTPSVGPATETPMAPANPTTVNPGNPDAVSGGSAIVPSSSVPTVNSDSALQNANSNNGNGPANGGGAGTGQVAPNFHLEVQMPPAGVTSNVSGSQAGISSSAVGAGQNSGPQTYTVPVIENMPAAQRPPNMTRGPEIIAAGDLAGMTYVGAVGRPAGASANQPAMAQVDHRSLGEIAAEYKRAHATQNARVFTNDDVQRLNARNDINVMGANNNTALPQGETAPQPAPQPKSQKRSPFAPKR